MKKYLIILLFVAGVSTIADAQVTLGVRGGWGAELSLQNQFKQSNRFEFDLGWYNEHGYNLTGVYQWTWNLDGLGSGFSWYAGLGPQLGIWNYNNVYDNVWILGLVGQIGIEYNFNIPLQLSLDYRPGWHMNYDYDLNNGVSLGVRIRL